MTNVVTGGFDVSRLLETSNLWDKMNPIEQEEILSQGIEQQITRVLGLLYSRTCNIEEAKDILDALYKIKFESDSVKKQVSSLTK